ncbi:MAG TPA: STAS domain-containing protein [Solirubrobacteraceae bacterium]
MTTHKTIDVEIYAAHAAVVTLRGEQDLATRPQVAVALAVARDCGNVLVDLSESECIDSSVINVLLLAADALVRDSGRLELVIPDGAHGLRSLFEAIGVGNLLAVHATRQAGMASVALAIPPDSKNPGFVCGPSTGSRTRATLPRRGGDLLRPASRTTRCRAC